MSDYVSGRHFSEGFLVIPNSLFIDKNLDPHEKIILCFMAGFHYVDNKKFTNGYISQCLGIPLRTIIRRINSLTEKGYIAKQYLTENKSITGYTVTLLFRLKLEMKKNDTGGMTERHDPHVTVAQPPCQSGTQISNNLNNNISKKALSKNKPKTNKQVERILESWNEDKNNLERVVRHTLTPKIEKQITKGVKQRIKEGHSEKAIIDAVIDYRSYRYENPDYPGKWTLGQFLARENADKFFDGSYKELLPNAYKEKTLEEKAADAIRIIDEEIAAYSRSKPKRIKANIVLENVE
jgi:hypothetical protein